MKSPTGFGWVGRNSHANPRHVQYLRCMLTLEHSEYVAQMYALGVRGTDVC